MLTLSVKGKYGIAAVFELAKMSGAKPLQIRAMAEACTIPQNYLEQILVDLKHAGLVKSFRGAQGGYALAKHAKDITINDVLLSLEGPSQIASSYCGCDTLTQFWTRIEGKLSTEFDVSFEELLKQKQKQDKTLTFSI
jgi:Rrf2 family transcriptional regulator, cysteine metabolism repressor